MYYYIIPGPVLGSEWWRHEVASATAVQVMYNRFQSLLTYWSKQLVEREKKNDQKPFDHLVFFFNGQMRLLHRSLGRKPNESFHKSAATKDNTCF